MAGALGSYALVGVLVGALLAGSRRRHPRPPQGDAVRLRLVLDRHGGDRVDDHHDDCSAAAVRHRPGRRRAGGHDRRAGRRVRPAGQEEPVQRHHLLRGADREPAGRPARHPAAASTSAGAACSGSARCRIVTLLAAGLLQDARVGGLAGRARPHDEARAISERTGVPMPEAVPARPKRPARCSARRRGRPGSPAYSALVPVPDVCSG